MMDQELIDIMHRPWADGSIHGVMLVREDATGKVLFWHRSKFSDPMTAAELWGQPIGTAWGTSLEVWCVSSVMATRLYPLPIETRKSQIGNAPGGAQ